jgi:hypothetical protein
VNISRTAEREREKGGVSVSVVRGDALVAPGRLLPAVRGRMNEVVKDMREFREK